MKDKLIELIKYGFWGCVSTAINLLFFYLFLFFNMQYILANVSSYIIAVIFSYIFNNLFVFKGNVGNNVEKGIKYFSMRGISVLIDSAILAFLCEICGINVIISKVIDSVIIIGLTFVVSKLFIFRKNDTIS